jgi:hypothetical protein
VLSEISQTSILDDFKPPTSGNVNFGPNFHQTMDAPEQPPTGTDSAQASSTQSAGKIKRRELFKRPIWQESRLRAERVAGGDGVEIFRRAEDTSRVIKQRELEKKERKVERQAERRNSLEASTDNAAPALSVRFIFACYSFTNIAADVLFML